MRLHRCIMRWEEEENRKSDLGRFFFIYGVPALPSGFPLYLFSLRSQRMPLQSLAQGALLLPGVSYIN